MRILCLLTHHKKDYEDIVEAISSITDTDLMLRHQQRKNNGIKSGLAPTINALLKEKLEALGWQSESKIFQGEEFKDKIWRLDFARGSVSIEVALIMERQLPGIS